MTESDGKARQRAVGQVAHRVESVRDGGRIAGVVREKQTVGLELVLLRPRLRSWHVFFFQAEDGIRDVAVTGVQTCALPISAGFGAAARKSSTKRASTMLLPFRTMNGSSRCPRASQIAWAVPSCFVCVTYVMWAPNAFPSWKCDWMRSRR